jgi:signal transduction histidine kinase
VEPDVAKRQLRVTISDRGPGVSEVDRESIFLRYERGAAGSGIEGTGLGLYVSRSLCRAMGGDLDLEPAAPDRGAAFSIALPGEPPATES